MASTSRALGSSSKTKSLRCVQHISIAMCRLKSKLRYSSDMFSMCTCFCCRCKFLARPCSGIDKLVSIYANLATVLQAGSCIQHASLLYAKLFRQTQKASCIDGSSCKLQIGLGIVLLPPLIAAITLILKNTGPLVAIYLWFFILVVSIFMMTIYPVAIAPLFNKFTPLPEGSLRYACYQTFLVTS